jgi:phage-related protein
MWVIVQTIIITLNPIVHPILELLSSGLFGLVDSTQKVIKGLFKAELFLFCKFHAENAYAFDLLM